MNRPTACRSLKRIRNSIVLATHGKYPIGREHSRRGRGQRVFGANPAISEQLSGTILSGAARIGGLLPLSGSRIVLSGAKFILTERTSVQVARTDIDMWKQVGRRPIPESQRFIDRYERYHEADLEHFGCSMQLLRLRLASGDEQEKLCEHLKLPPPTNIPFPRANWRSYGRLGGAVFRIARSIKDVFRYR